MTGEEKEAYAEGLQPNELYRFIEDCDYALYDKRSKEVSFGLSPSEAFLIGNRLWTPRSKAMPTLMLTWWEICDDDFLTEQLSNLIGGGRVKHVHTSPPAPAIIF